MCHRFDLISKAETRNTILIARNIIIPDVGCLNMFRACCYGRHMCLSRKYYPTQKDKMVSTVIIIIVSYRIAENGIKVL
jgi:hypothetical protein